MGKETHQGLNVLSSSTNIEVLWTPIGLSVMSSLKMYLHSNML